MSLVFKTKVSTEEISYSITSNYLAIRCSVSNLLVNPH